MAAHGHEYVVDTLTVPVDMSRGRADFLKHVSGADVNQDIATALDPRLTVEKDKVLLTVERYRDTAEWKRINAWICFSARVKVDGQLVAEGWGNVNKLATETSRLTIPLKWKPGGQQLAAAHPDKLTATVTGEPGGSTELYLQSTPLPATVQPAEAWIGSITVTPSTSPSGALQLHPSKND
jgi:hypothetical protein